MAEFIAFNPKAEVNGQTVLSIVDGMGVFKNAALEILSKNNILNPVANQWYLQQNWLNAFKEISDKIGANTLYKIGYKIPENADFPPEINSIDRALMAIDIAYHMNHRIEGEILFNPANGVMKEGIGHYGFEKQDDKNFIMVCNNPYPCDFDRGIIESMAKRFLPKEFSIVTVAHDNEKPCRKKGADSCTYKVIL